jgi:N utilization substance protein B
VKPSREATVQALYEAEASPESFDPGVLNSKVAALTAAILAEQEELDEAIEDAAINWRLTRMTPVDRAILRLGFYELRHHESTPVAVILNESVELAKKYSTEDSGSFVNGVLAELARRVRVG